jgi:hypothetical protein
LRICAERGERWATETHDLHVAVRSGDRDLEVRCRIDGKFYGGRYVVDVSVCYELCVGASEGSVAIGADAMNAFMSNVGIKAVYPFLREALHQSGSRLGLKPPVLPLLRLGRFKVTTDSAPEWTF